MKENMIIIRKKNNKISIFKLLNDKHKIESI